MDRRFVGERFFLKSVRPEPVEGRRIRASLSRAHDSKKVVMSMSFWVHSAVRRQLLLYRAHG
jgi:hypothetical protein